MSLTASVTSYPQTMVSFEAHWMKINESQPTPFVLKNGETVETLRDLRAQIQNSISGVNTMGMQVKDHSGVRRDNRAAFREKMRAFRAAASYRLAGKNYAADIAPLPLPTLGDGAYLSAANSYIASWKRANEDLASPLVLEDGTTLADFETEADAMRVSSLNTSFVVLDATNLRLDRNDLLLPARELLKTYRAAVIAIFGATSPAARTLPPLWEKKAAHPDALRIRVKYGAGESVATLLWAPKTYADGVRLWVEIGFGTRFVASDAKRIGELEVMQNSWTTPENTIAPNTVNWLRIVCADETGHLVGSNIVKVVRGA